MHVRTAALCAIVGFSANFTIRTLNTLWPTAFHAPFAAGIVAAGLVAGSTLLVVFFGALRKNLARSDRTTLESAAAIALAGATIAFLLDARNLLVVLGVNNPVTSPPAARLIALGGLAAAVAVAWFFAITWRELRDKLPETGGAVAGASFFAVLAVVSFLLTINGATPVAGEGLRVAVLCVVTLGIAAFYGVLRFFLALRRRPAVLERQRD
jgi:hypothetical protein